MTVFSDAGVDDEVLRRRVVDLGANDDLLVHQPEVDGVELVVGRPDPFRTARRWPNERRNRISARDQSAFSL